MKEKPTPIPVASGEFLPDMIAVALRTFRKFLWV